MDLRWRVYLQHFVHCYVPAMLDYSLQFFPLAHIHSRFFETLIIVLFEPSVVEYTNIQIHNKNAYLTGYYNELYKKKSRIKKSVGYCE